jgi:hypothetical protein
MLGLTGGRGSAPSATFLPNEDIMSEQVVADLSAGLPMDTADLHIVFPGTNKRTGWIITCAGPGHPKTIAANQESERERLHRAAQIERAQVNNRKWKGDDDITPDENLRKIVSGVVARIVSWTPVDFGQGPIEFSDKAAIDLFMDPKKGAYFGQVVDFLTAERAFMKDSAKP